MKYGENRNKFVIKSTKLIKLVFVWESRTAAQLQAISKYIHLLFIPVRDSPLCFCTFDFLVRFSHSLSEM